MFLRLGQQIDSMMDTSDGIEDDALRNVLLSDNGKQVLPIFTVKARRLKVTVLKGPEQETVVKRKHLANQF